METAALVLAAAAALGVAIAVAGRWPWLGVVWVALALLYHV